MVAHATAVEAQSKSDTQARERLANRGRSDPTGSESRWKRCSVHRAKVPCTRCACQGTALQTSPIVPGESSDRDARTERMTRRRCPRVESMSRRLARLIRWATSNGDLLSAAPAGQSVSFPALAAQRLSGAGRSTAGRPQFACFDARLRSHPLSRTPPAPFSPSSGSHFPCRHDSRLDESWCSVPGPLIRLAALDTFSP